MTSWGPRIEVNGVRPDWLRDEPFKVFTKIKVFTKTSEITGMTGDHPYQWAGIIAIALSADHPYYKATHAGYIYWPGGDKAPDDWDSGHVLRRDGGYMFMKGHDWLHHGQDDDVIGYKRRESAPPPPVPLTTARNMISDYIEAHPSYTAERCALEVINQLVQLRDAMFMHIRLDDMAALKSLLPIDDRTKRAIEIASQYFPSSDWYSNLDAPLLCALRDALSDA